MARSSAVPAADAFRADHQSSDWQSARPHHPAFDPFPHRRDDQEEGPPCPFGVLCHEHHRSTRRCATVREMKEGPSGSAIRSLIPSHRKLLSSKAMVVNVAEKSGQRFRQARLREASASESSMKCRKRI